MKNIYYSLFLLVLVAVAHPQLLYAASLTLEAVADTAQNQPVTIGVILKSPDHYVNALEGMLELPDNFTVDAVRDGRSVISMWIERPVVTSDTVRFSGIVPGGFQGDSGIVFEVEGRFNEAGIAEAYLHSVRLYSNDGLGTLLGGEDYTLSISVSTEVSERGAAEIVDNIPPASFVPIISRTPELNDDQWFIVFTTSDKGVGVSHYEVAEVSVWWPFGKSWKRAESPYVLSDQSVQRFVYVKAVDKAGNEYTVRLYPPIRNSLYLRNTFAGILLIVIAAGAWYLFRRRYKRSMSLL